MRPTFSITKSVISILTGTLAKGGESTTSTTACSPTCLTSRRVHSHLEWTSPTESEWAKGYLYSNGVEGLSMTSRDLPKIGYLYLNGETSDGTAIVPQSGQLPPRRFRLRSQRTHSTGRVERTPARKHVLLRNSRNISPRLITKVRLWFER